MAENSKAAPKSTQGGQKKRVETTMLRAHGLDDVWLYSNAKKRH